MDNYFDVPKIVGGQESGVKVIGGSSTRRTASACAYGWPIASFYATNGHAQRTSSSSTFSRAIDNNYRSKAGVGAVQERERVALAESRAGRDRAAYVLRTQLQLISHRPDVSTSRRYFA